MAREFTFCHLAADQDSYDNDINSNDSRIINKNLQSALGFSDRKIQYEQGWDWLATMII